MYAANTGILKTQSFFSIVFCEFYICLRPTFDKTAIRRTAAIGWDKAVRAAAIGWHRKEGALGVGQVEVGRSKEGPGRYARPLGAHRAGAVRARAA